LSISEESKTRRSGAEAEEADAADWQSAGTEANPKARTARNAIEEQLGETAKRNMPKLYQI
jgi:hypothetical protein